MISARTLIAALAVSVPISACDGDGISTGVDLTGTYTLEAVNGLPVPVTIFEDSEVRFEILSGSLRLQADRTYETPITFRLTDKFSGETQIDLEIETGTYQVSDGRITFTPDNTQTAPYVGTVEGRSITYTSEGRTATFRR